MINFSFIKTLPGSKLNNLEEHLKIFQDHINIILNSKESAGIFKIIEERMLINVLESDWQISQKRVDILEEIRRLSYIVSSLGNQDEYCKINLFYEYFENKEEFLKSNLEYSNEIQKIFFYFESNLLINYKKTFGRLSEESINSLANVLNNYTFNLLLLLSSLVFLLIFFFLSYTIKICNDYSYYKLIFLYYYYIEKEQIEFQNKIY